jgi:oxygen-independent coproporphyrinogen-3 oxidase
VLPDQEHLKKRFLEALFLEWEQQLPKLQGMEIASIYFGGGTPSLLGPKAIGTILGWVQSSLRLSPQCEITLEANPEEGASLSTFQSSGINRMSLGVQALDDSILHTLGRNHSEKDISKTLQAIYLSGIQNLSIDLMYEVPNQTLMSWKQTLKKVQNLPISHVSLYNLTFEPQTIFFKKKAELAPLLPSPEECLEFLSLIVPALQEMGLKRYEISAFAKDGFASCHNLGYWTARPFLGFGPSAFSYWEGKRFRNIPHLTRYAESLEKGESPVDFEEKLPFPQNLLELLAVELRLVRGVCLKDFQAKHGNLPEKTEKDLSCLIEKGWLHKKNDHINLTEKGLLFYDSVASEII